MAVLVTCFAGRRIGGRRCWNRTHGRGGDAGAHWLPQPWQHGSQNLSGIGSGEQLLTNRVSIILTLFPLSFGFFRSCCYDHILYSAHPQSPGRMYHWHIHLPTKRTNTKLYMSLRVKRKNPRVRWRYSYVACNCRYQAGITTYIKTIFITYWTWPISGDCDKNLSVPLLQLTGKGS